MVEATVVPSYVIATISGLSFLGTALVKRTISVGPNRTEPVFTPAREKVILRRTPAVVGACITLAIYQFNWLRIQLDTDLAVTLPSLVVGVLAGAASDFGYVWLRARVPWLDWLTNDSLYRASPTDAELQVAAERAVQPPPPARRSAFDDDEMARIDTEDEEVS